MPVVIRFGRLGDMVLQTPLLQLLHVRYGQPCRLITSGPWTSEILQRCPDVSGIWQLRRRHMPFLLSPERWRLAVALRGCKGPIYVSEDSARQLPKIRRLLRVAGVIQDRCLFLTDGRAPSPHWVDRLLHFGSLTPPAFQNVAPPADPNQWWSAPRLTVDDDDRADRDAWLHKHRISRVPIVLVQPGNKRAMKWGRRRSVDSKAWPVEFWTEFLRAVHAHRPNACILLCGSEAEEPLLTEIRRSTGASGVNVVTNDLPLRRLLALMEMAHSMVSVDTGPSHMAAAVGCPLVVLYGAESRTVWGRRSPIGKPIVELGGPPESYVARDIPVQRVVAAWCSLHS